MSIPNGVASAKPNPLGNGPVLLLGLGQLLLGLESLVALLAASNSLAHGGPKYHPAAMESLSRDFGGSVIATQEDQSQKFRVVTYRHFGGVVELPESAVDVVMFLQAVGMEYSVWVENACARARSECG